MLLLGHKLEMLVIHTAPIEAEVMYLPPPGTIRAGRKRYGSVRFRPRNPVGVFWRTATRKRDRGVAALARKASVPVKATGNEVDGVFAFQARGSTYS